MPQQRIIDPSETPGPVRSIRPETPVRLPVGAIVGALLSILGFLALGLWVVYQRTEGIPVIENKIDSLRESVRDLREAIRKP